MFVIGKERKRIMDKVENMIRELKSIRLEYQNGKTIVSNADAQKIWNFLVENPLNMLYAMQWIEGRFLEAQAIGRKEPFSAIINELPYLMVLVFGLNNSRSCIFHVEEDAYVRVAKGPHWHPSEDRSELKNISLPVKHLLAGETNYLSIHNPENNPETHGLMGLIEKTNIRSITYHLILGEWILIVDTTGEKECLNECEESFLRLISEQLQGIILAQEKIINLEKEHKAERFRLERETRQDTLEALGDIVSHHVIPSITVIGGLINRLPVVLKEGNKERIASYKKSIKEQSEKLELFCRQMRESINGCSFAIGSRARLQKLNPRKVYLSEIFMEAVNLLALKKARYRISSFIFFDIGQDRIKIDSEILRTAFYRILKKLFSLSEHLDVVIEICEKERNVMIIFSSDSLAIEPSMSKIISLKQHEKGELEDLNLFASFELLKRQGVEIWCQDNILALVFDKV